MQPLMSPVDHESRHNSNESDGNAARQTERTPLLNHQFVRNLSYRWSPVTAVVVTVMLLGFISGIIIGTYLLIVQQRSEPTDVEFRLVPRKEWDAGTSAHLMTGSVAAEPPAAHAHVLCVSTHTAECDSLNTCRPLLRSLKGHNESLPYNFLLSSDGWTYEALGWSGASTLFTELPRPSLVLAFIGNFTETHPSRRQVEQSRALCEESVRRGALRSSYTLVGRDVRGSPTGPPSLLFRALSRLPRWDRTLSDPVH